MPAVGVGMVRCRSIDGGSGEGLPPSNPRTDRAVSAVERRWYSLVNIPVQLGLLTLFLGGLVSVILVLSGFTWFCFHLFDRFVGALLSDPRVLEQVRGMVLERGYVALGTLMVVMTLFSFIVLRMTNRVAGPIYRITQELRRIHRTGEVHRIRVREDDYYQDFVAVLNRVLERIPPAPDDGEDG